jgi:hypothetical protein
MNHHLPGMFMRLLLFGLISLGAWQIGDTHPAAAQFKTKVNPKDGLSYIWISPGTFQMGCSPDDSCREEGLLDWTDAGDAGGIQQGGGHQSE